LCIYSAHPNLELIKASLHTPGINKWDLHNTETDQGLLYGKLTVQMLRVSANMSTTLSAFYTLYRGLMFDWYCSVWKSSIHHRTCR